MGAPKDPSTQDATSTAPVDKTATVADQGVDPAVQAKEQELAEREAAVAAREEEVNAAVDKVTSVLTQVEQKGAEIDAKAAELDEKLAAAGRSQATVAQINEERAQVVHDLQKLAYEGQEVGDDVDFETRVVLTNITKAGSITYLPGVKYQVPSAVAEDLKRREGEHLDYKENLHVRNDDVLNSGTISGGGK